MSPSPAVIVMGMLVLVVPVARRQVGSDVQRPHDSLQLYKVQTLFNLFPLKSRHITSDF